MSAELLAVLHLMRILQRLALHRGFRRRAVERGLHRVGLSRRRAEGIARRVP